MHSRQEKLEAFGKLLDVMDNLRAKCPWDRKQTNETLRPLTIEETYELADAILAKNDQEIKKELGDILLHIVFYAKIGSEQNGWDMADVCNAIVEKLIYRHPHIYGDVLVQNEDDVKSNWEKLKLKEGKKSIFEGVPNSMPSMVKAIRLQEKAKGVGFEWPNSAGAIAKMREELDELEQALKFPENEKAIESEFGDFLFSVINTSRYFNVNSDNALERTNRKFKSRFEHIENRCREIGKEISDMTLNEMDEFWEEAKSFEP
ncbi:MAG: nucleoside triphosphate pyrophosphohydrolase [Bacteroidetes bacterium]|nr:nucleoside triphosphate pyrophosphohydrolase [Bacteroidota bacterium]